MGSVEKIHHADNTQEWRCYIHGSVNVITDGAGKITDLLAFDPWGKRRAESNWTPLPLSATQSSWFVGAKPKTSRGFTGHQMADEMEIIHMGGRIYDPLLGRFLQADPFIQSPSTTASLNRYSYVWNNPLNATDPSGFFLSSLWKEIRPYVGAIAAVGLAVYAPWAAEVWAPIVNGMIAGAAGAAANGGDVFKGMVSGAFSGAAAMGGVWTSALWGGADAYMNGGAFGRGFIAAGIGAYGGGGTGGPSWEGFVRSAVLGGVATEVTGGKFKNGAASAAFMYAVSAGVRAARQGNGELKLSDEKVDENGDPIPSGPYDKFDQDRAKSLGLSIDGNKISGTVKINCVPYSVGCGEVTGYLSEVWSGQVGDYTLDIKFEQARAGSGVLSIYGKSLGSGVPAVAHWREVSSWRGSRYDISIFVDRDNWSSSNVALRKSVINHEFGHAIGFSHRGNSTQSFMSCSRDKPYGPRVDDLNILFGSR